MTILYTVFAFIVAIATLGFVVGRRLDYEGYWLDNRRAKRLALTATIVATQVGAGTTLGIAASTANSGTGYGIVAVITTFVGFLILPVLAPPVTRVANASGEFTLTGLFRWRYGRLTGLASSAVVAAAYLALLAGQLTAGAALMELLTPLSWAGALAISSVLVVVYSAFAGLKGDLVTDLFLFVFQTILLCLTVFVLARLFGQEANLLAQIPASTWSPVRFGGVSYLIGGTLIGVLVPLVSLEMWLRVFAADQAAEARAAFRWASAIVVPFYLAPLAIGAASVAILGPSSNPQTIFVQMLDVILSRPLMLLVYVGLIATIISTSNTLQLVLAAVVHRDLLPGARQSVSWSRLIAMGVGLIAAGFAYFIRDIVTLVLSGFFYIVLLGPLLVGMILKPSLALKPTETQDRTTAVAVVVGVALTTVGFPLLGPGAVLIGFVIIAITLVTMHLLESRTWNKVNG